MAARDRMNPRIVDAALIGVCMVLSWKLRFVQDDGLISFRYAQHLADGYGLVWNRGEPPIEGFTNLLFTLLLALGMKVGIEPFLGSYVIGLASMLATLLAVRRLTKAHFGVAAFLLGINLTFVRYATGGLETQLQTALLTWAFALAEPLSDPKSERRAFVAAGVLWGLAMWTRLDSALFGAPLVWSMLGGRLRIPGERRASLGGFVLASALGLGSLIVYKLRVFGAILPNTFYAKSGGVSAIRVWHGVEYICLWSLAYALPVAFVMVVLHARKAPGGMGGRRLLQGALVLVAVWFPYVVWNGGDFMELRFLVAPLPILVAAISCEFATLSESWKRAKQAALALSTLMAALYTWDSRNMDFARIGPGVQTFRSLENLAKGWGTIGRTFRRYFGGCSDRPVSIAVGAAGAIPYFSGLRTIDIFGLNDATIARHGKARPGRPGHERLASLDYLIEQKVNLVPWWPENDPAEPLPAGATYIDIVIPRDGDTPEYWLPTLYLTKNPAIDAIVARERWRVRVPKR
jgi:arabinofuranosyltransferase